MEQLLTAIVAEASRRDPSLPADVARQLATAALEAPVDAEAPEIARRLLEQWPELDASWVNAVATSISGVRPV